jgi:hypothetical protein
MQPNATEVLEDGYTERARHQPLDLHGLAIVKRLARCIRAAIPEAQVRVTVFVQAGVELGVLQFAYGCPDES